MPMVDLLIRGGRIVDGMGNPWFRGDVAIQGDRIAEIGRLEGVQACEVLTVPDLVVSPGFIAPVINCLTLFGSSRASRLTTQTGAVGRGTAFTRAAASFWSSLVSRATSAFRSRVNSLGGAVARRMRTSSRVGTLSARVWSRRGLIRSPRPPAAASTAGSSDRAPSWAFRLALCLPLAWRLGG
jgi:imidazolonepropionase-like amidohydrolase